MSFATTYRETLRDKLQKDLTLHNTHEVPRITKITVNAGIGKYLQSEKNPSKVVEAIKLITGQSPIVNKARMAISNFKLREGMPVGCSVTLRKQRMYDFLERVVTYTAPRIRDFQGFSHKSFDGRGNYSFGIREHTVFPEIPQDDVVKPFGLQITITTTAETDEQAKALLKEFNFPFTR